MSHEVHTENFHHLSYFLRISVTPCPMWAHLQQAAACMHSRSSKAQAHWDWAFADPAPYFIEAN